MNTEPFVWKVKISSIVICFIHDSVHFCFSICSLNLPVSFNIRAVKDIAIGFKVKLRISIEWDVTKIIPFKINNQLYYASLI